MQGSGAVLCSCWWQGELTSFIALTGQKVHSMNLHVPGTACFGHTAMFPKESHRPMRALPCQGGRPSSQATHPTLLISGAHGVVVLSCRSPGVYVAAV